MIRPYKGYRCKARFNPDLNLFEGEVMGAGAPIYFEAATKKAIKKEFRTSVDLFLEWCAEKGGPPNEPMEDVFITLQLEEGLLKTVEANWNGTEKVDTINVLKIAQIREG